MKKSSLFLSFSEEKDCRGLATASNTCYDGIATGPRVVGKSLLARAPLNGHCADVQSNEEHGRRRFTAPSRAVLRTHMKMRVRFSRMGKDTKNGNDQTS